MREISRHARSGIESAWKREKHKWVEHTRHWEGCSDQHVVPHYIWTLKQRAHICLALDLGRQVRTSAQVTSFCSSPRSIHYHNVDHTEKLNNQTHKPLPTAPSSA